MATIPYESECFPDTGPVPNGRAVLSVSWEDLLWAAVTVGRPNWHCVFQHGVASIYEAIFRWSVIRMALEQTSAHASRLKRTAAFDSLDPTEKGAVNYFLGMTLCKLFTWKLLDAPWALHFDVFGDQVRAHFSGRSRPDMIANTFSGEWIVLEAKGRNSPPSSKTKEDAKAQADVNLTVNGQVPQWRIAGISFFSSESLGFYWIDPSYDPRHRSNNIAFEISEQSWKYYYAPIMDLARSRLRGHDIESIGYEPLVIEEADLQIQIEPGILSCLLREDWGEARRKALYLWENRIETKYYPDGVMVTSGPSWKKPMEQATFI